MAAIAAEHRTTGREERPRPRVVLPQRMKSQQDRAVVRALLRVLGVTFTDAEIIAPVTAPVDVRFRHAQFHLRALGDPLRGWAWPAQDTRVPQTQTPATRGNLRPTVGERERAVRIAHVTAALAEHAAWYGARCIGLDVVVTVEGNHAVLTPPAQARESEALAQQGWRSVSVVCPPYGMVLAATSGAPAFLRLVTGRLCG
jgi:hypothetical protein